MAEYQGYIVLQRLADDITRYLDHHDRWALELRSARRFDTPIQASMHALRLDLDPFSIAEVKGDQLFGVV